MSVLDFARAYIARNWNPVVIPPRQKKPVGEEWQKRTITIDNVEQFFTSSDLNIGVQLGPKSRGLTDVDLDCPETMRTARYLLPRTEAVFGRPSKPNSHYLYYTTLASFSDSKAALQFKDPDNKRQGGVMLLEVRIGGADKGAQTVFPGSTHPSGEIVQWWAGMDREPATIDDDVLLQAAKRTAGAALIARQWPAVGGRHDAGLIVGGFFARGGIPESEAKLIGRAIACAAESDEAHLVRQIEAAYYGHRNGSNTYGYTAFQETFDNLNGKIARKCAEWFDYNGTDREQNIRGAFPVPDDDTDLAQPHGETPAATLQDRLALQFAMRYQDKIRYVDKWGKWFVWNGACWKEDNIRWVYNKVRDFVRDYEARYNVGKRNQAHMVVAKMTREVIEFIKSDQRLAATPDQWDIDIWMLNTPEGIVDLHTGEMRKQQPTDYCRKITSVSPAPFGNDCPLFMAFLEKITDYETELMEYLQRVFGYSLTGSVREHAMFFKYGEGDNGKSVLTNTISCIMGDYHKTASMDAFIDTKNPQHPTDMANLVGARLVTATETEQGRQWAEAKITNITGGTVICARRMREDFFEFMPQFKLMIDGNHKPRVRSVNNAIRRRMRLIPFTVNIPEKEQDKQFAQKLVPEHPAILRWMIAGCLEWQRKDGLDTPKTVKDATEEYLKSENKLEMWLEERCNIEDGPKTASAILYKSFCDWSLTIGDRYPIGYIDFGRKLAARLGRQSTDVARAQKGFEGIRLLTDEECGIGVGLPERRS